MSISVEITMGAIPGDRGDQPLQGHSSSKVTETVYRHQIRPVITVRAEAMDKIFANEH